MDFPSVGDEPPATATRTILAVPKLYFNAMVCSASRHAKLRLSTCRFVSQYVVNGKA